MTQNRGGFQTKLGVVLATAGSAVGLGNIWRFPYMTGQNGGAAFILIYIGCVLLLGIPGMVSEFIVGRHSSANAARAYRMMPVKGPWGAIGYLGVFTSIIILWFLCSCGRLVHALFLRFSFRTAFRRCCLCEKIFFRLFVKRCKTAYMHCWLYTHHPSCRDARCA